MTVLRKVAIPAAMTTLVIGGVPAATAIAAPRSHGHDGATPTRSGPRRARTIDILDYGHIRPDSATNSSSSNDTNIRFHVQGSKSIVDYMSVTSVCTGLLAYWPKAHIEIQKPNGTALKNGPVENLGREECMEDVDWVPTKAEKVSTGDWHAILWNHQTNGTYKNVVSTEITVEK